MPFKPTIQTSPLTISTPNHEKKKEGEKTLEKKEAIVRQVSINFLQKEARLNVSGLLKCSFHRGEAEKRDEGRVREEKEEELRRRSGTGCNSFGPSAHQIVWWAKNAHGSESV